MSGDTRGQGVCLDWGGEITDAPAQDVPERDEAEGNNAGEQPPPTDESGIRPKRRSFLILADDDDYEMRRRCPESFSKISTVWRILLREARLRNSLTVEMSRFVLADRAALGERKTEDYLQLLKTLGMLSWKAERNRSSGKFHTRKITLKPAVSPCAVSYKNAHGNREQSPCAVTVCSGSAATNAQTDTSSRGLKPPLDGCNKKTPSHVFSGGNHYVPPRTREGSSEGEKRDRVELMPGELRKSRREG